MSERGLPPYPTTDDWKTWATQMVEFLSGQARSEEFVAPRSVGLAHQAGDPNDYRAPDAGIMMYDPANDRPVVSKGGQWQPIHLGPITEGDITDLNRLRWRGNWLQQEYVLNDVVLDYPYLAVANKTTTDRPAPQDQGAPFWVYQGTEPTDAITAKSLLVGNTYQLPVALRIPNLRVYTITGNFYSVFLTDLSTGVVDEVATFTADSTGWRTIAAKGAPLAANTAFEIGVYVQEPDPTPTTFTLSYDYDTPNNPIAPGVGMISHANQALSELRINKTDQNGDQSLQLATIDVGDTIEGAGVRWSVQAITDNGTWINFAVAPASQGAPDGIQDFIFETVTATPITTIIDPDYYLTNANVTPFFEIDGGGRQPSDDGYGVDIEIQQISVSEDWDLMANSGSGTAAGGGDGTGGVTVPIGGIVPYGGTTVPDPAFMICDGTAISRTEFTNLFDAIGTAYGAGDGSTTFNIPNLQGVFIRGTDNGRGLDSGRVHGSYQADEFKSHRHQNFYADEAQGSGQKDTVMSSGKSKWGGYTGGAETRGKNVSVNYLIRVS